MEVHFILIASVCFSVYPIFSFLHFWPWIYTIYILSSGTDQWKAILTASVCCFGLFFFQFHFWPWMYIHWLISGQLIIMTIDLTDHYIQTLWEGVVITTHHNIVIYIVLLCLHSTFVYTYNIDLSDWPRNIFFYYWPIHLCIGDKSINSVFISLSHKLFIKKNCKFKL